MAFVGVVVAKPVKKGQPVLEKKSLELSELQSDLTAFLQMMEEASKGSEGFSVDEAKLRVAIFQDEHGEIKAGLGAQVLGLLKGELGAKIGGSLKEEQVIEFTLRRRKKE